MRVVISISSDFPRQSSSREKHLEKIIEAQQKPAARCNRPEMSPWNMHREAYPSSSMFSITSIIQYSPDNTTPHISDVECSNDREKLETFFARWYKFRDTLRRRRVAPIVATKRPMKRNSGIEVHVSFGFRRVRARYRETRIGDTWPGIPLIRITYSRRRIGDKRLLLPFRRASSICFAFFAATE